MKQGLLAAVSLVFMSGVATAQVNCRTNEADGFGGMVAFFSSNTDNGYGNGGEIATIFGCASGIPGDQDVDIGDGLDPVGGFIATDPGDSGNRGRGGRGKP